MAFSRITRIRSVSLCVSADSAMPLSMSRRFIEPFGSRDLTYSHSARDIPTAPASPEEPAYTIDAISGWKIFEKESPQKSYNQSLRFFNLQPPTIDRDGPAINLEEMKAYSKPYFYREAQLLSTAVNAWGISDDELKIYRKINRTQLTDTKSPSVRTTELGAYGSRSCFNKPAVRGSKTRTSRSALDDILAEHHHQRHRTKEANTKAATTDSQSEKWSIRQLERVNGSNSVPGKRTPILNFDGPPIAADERLYYSQMFLYNEPDGQLKGTRSDTGEAYDDLHLYRAHPVGPVLDDEAPPISTEEIEHYKQPFHHNEPDGKPVDVAENVNDREQIEEELNLYRKSASNVSLTQADEPQNSKYSAVPLNDSKGRFLTFQASQMEESDVLDCLRASDVREFARDVAVVHPDSGREQLKHVRNIRNTSAIDLKSKDYTYNSVDIQNVPEIATGNFARDFPGETSVLWRSTDGTLSPSEKSLKLCALPVLLNVSESPVATKDATPNKATPRHIVGNSWRSLTKLQPALDRHISKKAGVQARTFSDPQPSCHNRRIDSEPLALAARHTLCVDDTGLNDAKPMVQNGLLIRRQSSDTQLPLSNIIMDLQDQLRQSWYMIQQWRLELAKILAQQPVHQIESPAFNAAPRLQASLSESVVYKILLYDPKDGKVRLADVDTVALDNIHRVPALEALMKSDHLAEFHPFFEELHAKGFEIFNGSKDKLIFRRIGAATASKDLDAQLLSNNKFFQSLVHNPDEGRSISSKTQNRVEQVGRDQYESPFFQSREQKRSLGKRVLMGAAWVAGCSYMIGLVSENLTTNRT